MSGINLQLFNSKLIEYQFLTMCLKSYIFRKTYGFAQKNIAQNRAKLIAFHAQK